MENTNRKIRFLERLILVLSVLLIMNRSLSGTVLADQPSSPITNVRVINSENTWDSEFTIGNGGHIRVDNTTLTINGSITNNAQNTKSATGSALANNAFRITGESGKLVLNNHLTLTQGAVTGSTIFLADTNGSKLEINNSKLALSAGTGTPFIWMYPGAEAKFTNLIMTGQGKITNLNVFLRVGGDQSSETAPGGTIIFNGENNNIENIKGKIRNYGTIKVASGATLTISNCDIDLSNTGTGPVFTVENGGNLIIESSSFSGYTGSSSVIVSEAGTVTITNSTFTNNKTSGSGAVLHASKESKVQISGGVFQNNTAHDGGAFFIVDSKMTVQNGTNFEQNHATATPQETLLMGGGAIHAVRSQMTILDNVSFTNNDAVLYGGAIHHEGGILILGSENSSQKPTFSQNKATNQWNSRGGAVALEIYCDGTSEETCNNSAEPIKVTIYDAEFDNNQAGLQGGAMSIGCNPRTGDKRKTYKEVNVDILKGKFINNRVTNNNKDGMAGGAVMIFANGSLKMRKVAITGNTAASAGGGIATCGTGNTYLFIKDGAAIFDNIANFSGAAGYQDLYVFDHSVDLDINEEMFNGGLHNWQKLDNQPRSDTGLSISAYYGSNPTSKSIEGYNVLFQNNTVETVSGTQAPLNGNGGAIGNNGTLIIGGTTKVLITKNWVGDTSATRPRDKIEFVKSLNLKENDYNYELTDFTNVTCPDSYQVNTTSCFTAKHSQNGVTDTVTFIVAETDENTWTVELTGLPSMLHDNDKDVDVVVNWTLEEHMDSYISSVEQTQDKDKTAFVITNELNVKTISGKKEWDYTSIRDSAVIAPNTARPDSIKIHLHKEGEDAEEDSDKPFMVTKASAPDWVWKFEDVPVKENGTEIKYSVHEVPVYDYTQVQNTKLDDGTYYFKNQYDPENTDIVVYKDWKDDSNWDGSRPDSVHVILYRTEGDSKVKVREADLKQDNEWIHIFTDLDENQEYTVDESPVPDGYNVTVKEKGEHSFEVINTHVHKVAQLTVKKTWDETYKGYRPLYTAKDFVGMLKLMANGEEYKLDEITEVAGKPGLFTAKATAGDVSINVNMPEGSNSWTVIYSNLPAKEKAPSNNDIVWTVEEEPVEHYSLEASDPAECVKSDGNGKTCTITITNSLHFTQLKLTKIWNDNGDEPSRPDPILFLDGLALYHDGIYLPHGTFYKDPNKPSTGNEMHYKVTSNSNLEVTVTMDGNKWIITIDKLMQWFENEDGVMEKVKVWTAEEFVEGYHSEAETLEDGTISITNEPFVINVEKVWESSNREQPEIPESITVRLIADGEETDQTIELTPDGNWIGSFTGMRKYEDDGRHEIVYTVREENVPEGYISSVTGDAENGFVITNSLPPERTWFRLPELPKTGFSAVRPTALNAQPLNVSYVDSGLTLQVPSLDVKADIVTVPFVDGEYPVEWLGMQAGMLEGSAKPGEGMMVLTGHNTLNSTEAGPFAFLSFMEEGDMIFLLNRYNQLKPYTVYAVEKISATDSAALERIASMDENSLTMLTCEDELPEGGYASRRVVAAKPVGTW